jgi:hypothetical protein
VLAEDDPAQTVAKIIATLWPYGEPNPESAADISRGDDPPYPPVRA